MDQTFTCALDAAAARNRKQFSEKHATAEHAITAALDHFAAIFAASNQSLNTTDRRHLGAIACASHVLQLCYGSLELMRMGQMGSATILARTALESEFALFGFVDDQLFENGNDFFMRLRYKAIHAAMKDKQRYLKANTKLSPEGQTKIQAAIDHDAKFLEQNKAHRLTTVRDLAALADREDAYIREYAFFSRDTHADLDGMVNGHLALKNGKTHINAVVFDQSKADEVGAHLVAILMDSAAALGTLFQVEETEAQKEASERLGQFYGEAMRRASVDPFTAHEAGQG